MCLPSIYALDGHLRRRVTGHKSIIEGHVRSDLSLPDVGDGRFNREVPPWAAMDPDVQGGRLFAVEIFGVGGQTDVVVSLSGSDPGAPAETKHRHRVEGKARGYVGMWCRFLLRAETKDW